MRLLAPFVLILALCSQVVAFQAPSGALRAYGRSLLHVGLPSKVASLKMSSDNSRLVKPAPQPASSFQIPQSLKIGSMFGLWYALNIGYNIFTKKFLNAVPQLSYSLSFLQLVVGMLYVVPMWITGMSKVPTVSGEDFKGLVPMATLHVITQLASIVSLSAGAISFTSVVKAAEPAVSAFLSAVFFKSFMPIPVYLSLVPIMAGVGYAALGELSFSKLSFGAAMLSNFASAGRALVSKKALGKSSSGKKMSAADLYSVMTLMSAIAALPICLALEGHKIIPTIKTIQASGKGRTVAMYALLSSVFYYLSNQVSFMTLDKVAPVTHAVGNTIKRVVIITASMMVFGTRMTMQGALGSAVAIAGVFLYSLTKNYYSSKDKAAKAK